MKKLIILIISICTILSSVSIAKNIDDDFYTVLAIGVDSRSNNYNGNTDVLMLISYNKLNQEVNCISIQRDTYVKNLNDEWCKINAIYHRNGLEDLIKVINKTYNVNVTRYVLVTWKDIKEVIDTVGYVDVSLTDKEFEYINAYIHETALACGETNPAKYYVERNVKCLVGIQAVAYARLRVMDSDRKRMERQQKVIKSMLTKFLKMSALQQLGIIKKLNDGLKTNFGPSEIWNVTKSAGKISINTTAVTPSSNNYCVLKTVNEWACMPKNWCKESSDILNILYGKYKTPTEYINKLENDSRGLRK